MKYKSSLIIAKPRTIVTKYFADPQYLGNYQDGFIGKELVRGEQSQSGAISKMYYKMGNREMELIETIISNQLPDRFEAHYHHKQMDNSMICNFVALDDQTTRYEYEYEYTRLNWVLPKLMAILFPSIYRKQVEKWMLQFKEFVEAQ